MAMLRVSIPMTSRSARITGKPLLAVQVGRRLPACLRASLRRGTRAGLVDGHEAVQFRLKALDAIQHEIERSFRNQLAAS